MSFVVNASFLQIKEKGVLIILNAQLALNQLSSLVYEVNHLDILRMNISNERSYTFAFRNSHHLSQDECANSHVLIVIMH